MTFPLIGRVKAAGLTLRSLAEALKTQFGDGFLKNPQVAVSIDEYKSQRVFVMGEVRTPGAYQLTGDMTIIEALAKAGGITQTARRGNPDREAAVRARKPVRRCRTTASLPCSRSMSANCRPVRSRRTCCSATATRSWCGRSQAVYVFGQVRAPGAYPIDRGTSVLQALSLAGGVTDRGSTGRIKVVRALDGKKKELKVRLTDIVEPGDTLIVGERFF